MQVKSNSQQSNNCNAATPKLNANMKTAKKLENEKKIEPVRKIRRKPRLCESKAEFQLKYSTILEVLAVPRISDLMKPTL